MTKTAAAASGPRGASLTTPATSHTRYGTITADTSTFQGSGNIGVMAGRPHSSTPTTTIVTAVDLTASPIPRPVRPVTRIDSTAAPAHGSTSPMPSHGAIGGGRSPMISRLDPTLSTSARAPTTRAVVATSTLLAASK